MDLTSLPPKQRSAVGAAKLTAARLIPQMRSALLLDGDDDGEA